MPDEEVAIVEEEFFYVSEQIAIYEVTTNKVLGFLLEISLNHMSVISNKPYEEGYELLYRIINKFRRNNSEEVEMHHIEFMAQVISVKDLRNEKFKIGLKYQPLNNKSKQRAEHLINDIRELNQ